MNESLHVKDEIDIKDIIIDYFFFYNYITLQIISDFRSMKIFILN